MSTRAHEDESCGERKDAATRHDATRDHVIRDALCPQSNHHGDDDTGDAPSGSENAQLEALGAFDFGVAGDA